MTEGEKVIAFIEEYCRVPEGKDVGQQIKLADFQKKFILAVYDNKDETRRAYLSIARKNGKTALIACLLLAHLVGPKAKLNSQIVSGALSREQAGLVFNLASKMINLDERLASYIRIVPSGKKLIGLPRNVEYRALAAEGSTAHGLSPVLAILDEVGQVKGPRSDFIDAITTAQGAYDDPLLIAISTQAPTDADLFSIWLDDATSSSDKNIVSHVYTADEECDLSDESAWKAANPAMGIFRSQNDIAQQAEQAKRMPINENTFRVLTLNQRVNMVSSLVSPQIWKIGDRPLKEFSGLVYGGLDLSATTDLTALVLVCKVGEELHVRSHFWMPAESVTEASKRDRAPYDLWVKQGYLHTTPSRVIDYDHVAVDIARITKDLNIATIAFDRWRMDRMKLAFERAELELPLEPFGQGYKSMSPAIDSLEADILNENLVHGGNPVLTMCAMNAVAISDPAGNRKLEKSKATGRIDGMVALVMAKGVQAAMGKEIMETPWDTDPNFSLADL